MPDATEPPGQRPANARRDVEVAPLADFEAPDVVALLGAAERTGGDIPLVDEAERLRLQELADGGRRADGWAPVVARLAGRIVGYGAAVVSGADTGSEATGDAAALIGRDAARSDGPDATGGPDRSSGDGRERAAVLQALLGRLADVASDAGAGELEVWVRDVIPTDLDAATAASYQVERRLGILGADLPVTTPAPEPPPAITVRASRPDADDEAIVAVLAAAYGDGPDGGWDLARFRGRRALDWYRPDDLLLAVDADDRVLGLHWLKRRSPTVGEVYNLAVHPDAQGLRLGPVLLRAGLDHLAATGSRQVLLWVDRANDRAVRLYTSQGMVTRWDDVALGRSSSDDASADAP